MKWLVLAVIALSLAGMTLAQVAPAPTRPSGPQPTSTAPGTPPHEPAAATTTPIAPQRATLQVPGSSNTSPTGAPVPAAPRTQRPATPSGQPLREQPGFSLQGAGPSLPGTPMATPPSGPQPLEELLVRSSNLTAAEAQQQDLEADGFMLLSRRELKGLGYVLSIYSLPPGDPADWLERQRQLLPPADLELNQRYYPLGEANPEQWGQQLLGPTHTGCGQGLRLALIDTGVAIVPALQGASIQRRRYALGLPADPSHGTAIAALLLGRGPVAGLVPAAQLTAIDVFARNSQGQPETHSDWLLGGLDALAETPPHAVNLSFGGEPSALLTHAFELLTQRTRLVAAAGNAGRDSAMFPASLPAVQAVSAVDTRLKRWRRSNYGGIAFAAPGVDIWTSDASGQGLYLSGTSYAAPFVTAALGLAALHNLSLEHIQQQSRDLGTQGYDPEFGHGLPQLNCAPL